ncbi:MAG: ABC transporter permease subunit [Kiritimatiellaeota bacterium]|nr:ABC transporter permease subunit [Kiritimatiellota bacterium]
MGKIRIIASRELRGHRAGGFAHALAAGYLFLTGALWLRALHAQEGTLASAALWAQLHASCLPLLAVCATARSFAAERQQGTFDLLMTTPVPHADIVAAKWLAAYALTLWTLLLAALAPVVALPVVATGAAAETSLPALAAGFAALALQAALWTAAGIFIATLFRSQVFVAMAGLLFTVALPFGLRFFELAPLMPLASPDVVAVDAACGVFSLFPAVCYATLAPTLLFFAARALDLHFYRIR